MGYGWIEGTQKNKLIIIPPQGKPKLLLPNRIAYSWREKKLPFNTAQAHETLKLHMKQAELYKQTFELETMHSLLENMREYTLEELAVDFLDEPENSVCKLGLFLALHEDSFWFKNNRNLTYTPRTSAELAVLEVQFTRLQEQKKRAVIIQKWIKQLESGEWNANTNITAEQQNWLDQQLNLLIDGTESPYWKEMSTLLDWGTSFGIGEENSLKRWLAGAGTSVSTSRLTLLRANVREEFPEEVLADVERVRNLPTAKLTRSPAEVQTFTIDGDSTLDYDDAFSVLEWNKAQLIVAVHITDLSHSVHPGDPLFKEAEDRISSVYTIERTIPM
ncbi:MAG: RNB domain-containing ribonuclease, partial [SAR324 cluster bacterium]|nr:RNB domain-containing ribonuclease [SAR324 cluster bacterium]